LGWNVEENQFRDQTPYGEKTFTNIIATLNPNACKRIVLSCHYDSKYFANFNFLGATDSAVPCTMILELVRILDSKLKKKLLNNNEMTLQLMFFDGEEAFKDWTATDSLYGSRHLASKLDSTPMLRSNVVNCETSSALKTRLIQTELDRIEVLILLDLIGEASPQFCSHFAETKELFNKIIQIGKCGNGYIFAVNSGFFLHSQQRKNSINSSCWKQNGVQVPSTLCQAVFIRAALRMIIFLLQDKAFHHCTSSPRPFRASGTNRAMMAPICIIPPLTI